LLACVLVSEAGRRPHREARTFRTVTRELEALREWLQERRGTHVGMESTSIYRVLDDHIDATRRRSKI
jgi:hypothetical protein